MTHADSSASALQLCPSVHFLNDELTSGGGPDVA
jgi:hypothetical protein